MTPHAMTPALGLGAVRTLDSNRPKMATTPMRAVDSTAIQIGRVSHHSIVSGSMENPMPAPYPIRTMIANVGRCQT